MYGKCALRLIHHTYPNLNEFRVVVSQVQRCRRLVQDMKSGVGGERWGRGAFLCGVNYNDTGAKPGPIPLCSHFLKMLQHGGWGCTPRSIYSRTFSHGGFPKALWLRLAREHYVSWRQDVNSWRHVPGLGVQVIYYLVKAGCGGP